MMILYHRNFKIMIKKKVIITTLNQTRYRLNEKLQIRMNKSKAQIMNNNRMIHQLTINKKKILYNNNNKILPIKKKFLILIFNLVQIKCKI